MHVMKRGWLVGGLVGVMLGFASLTTALAAMPDAWITSKTKLSLLTNEGLSATKINVDTVDGVVTLHGKVRSDAEKAKAEEVARRIEGVKQVRNLLTVVPPEREEKVEASDAEIKKRVEEALKADKSLADSSISVQSVNNGVVLLAGKAESISDHLRAVERASSVRGVRRVASEIKSPDMLADREIWRDRPGATASADDGGIGGAANDMYITSATKLRLLADSRTPALDINVDTNDGTVTLFGIVPSTEAKAAAEEDARKVSGIKRVVNELQVVPKGKQEDVKARDQDVEQEVERALDARNIEIEVDVQNGVARLTGTVPSEQERLAAAIAARSTRGVRSVQDDLRVNRDKAK